MKKILIANWKMNTPELTSWFETVLENKDSGKITTVICPTYLDIKSVGEYILNSGIFLGAQNMFYEDKGAFTGEISGLMLKNIGVEYIIIGHSERRALGESNELINKKVLKTLELGLKPVLCVGESATIRKHGIAAVKKFIENQLASNLKEVGNLENVIIAYEPIWAIGTGISAKPEEAIEIIKFIKDLLSKRFNQSETKVLYGGSVDAKNIISFVGSEIIDGSLVGGASLKSQEFSEMVSLVSGL